MKAFILTMVLFIASTNADADPPMTDITSIIEDCGRVYLCPVHLPGQNIFCPDKVFFLS